MIEPSPEDQLLQRDRPNNTCNGLVEPIPERQLPQRVGQDNPSDGLVEGMSELKALQGGRPLHPDDEAFVIVLESYTNRAHNRNATPDGTFHAARVPPRP